MLQVIAQTHISRANPNCRELDAEANLAEILFLSRSFSTKWKMMEGLRKQTGLERILSEEVEQDVIEVLVAVIEAELSFFEVEIEGVFGYAAEAGKASFGQEQTTSTDPNNYKFATLERDSDTGLDHAMFRQYSSVAGRWMSPDPYNGSMDLGNPQSLNRYAYVGNMPLNLTDRTGLFFGFDDLATIITSTQETTVTASFNPIVLYILGGAALAATIGELGHDLGLWGTHPAFHGSLKPRPNAPSNKPPCSANQTFTIPRELQQAMLRNEGWTLRALTLTSKLGINGFQAYAFRNLHLGSLDITGNTDVFVNGTRGGFSAYTLGGSVIVGNTWLGQVDVTSLQFANGAFADVHGSAGVIPGSWFGINTRIQSGLNSNPDAISAAKALSQKLDTCTY